MAVPQQFHPVTNTVEVTLKASRAGQERRNIIHYRYQNPRPTSAELLNLLNDMELAVLDTYENFVALGTVWYEVTAADIHDQGGAFASKQVNRLGVGGSQVFPGQVSHCLTKRTGARGRSYRGRLFLIDLPEDYFNGDDMNPIYLPTVTQFANQLLTQRQNGRFVPCVASRHLNGSTDLNAITFDLIADTQRRRGKGRGI